MPPRSFGSSAFAAAVLTIAVGCGGGGGGSATTSPTPAALVVTASVTVDGKATTILTDSKGMTLYYFTPDKGGQVTCKGGCLAVWPPLLLPAGATTPTGGQGVTGSLTTIANPDGKGTQVMYNSWPLYYYVKDTKPGDATGQNVGGKWFVVPPDLAPGM